MLQLAPESLVALSAAESGLYISRRSRRLGVATKAPRKGRPAAIGRDLLRLVIHEPPPEFELIGQ